MAAVEPLGHRHSPHDDYWMKFMAYSPRPQPRAANTTGTIIIDVGRLRRLLVLLRRYMLPLVVTLIYIVNYLTVGAEEIGFHGEFYWNARDVAIGLSSLVVISMIISYGGYWLHCQLEQRLSWLQKPLLRLLIEAPLIAGYAVAVNLILSPITGWFIGIPSPITVLTIYTAVLSGLVVMFVHAFNRLQEMLYDARLQRARQHVQALQAQYSALKQQLSPHFLFNTLSALTGMIHREPDDAVELVLRLSSIYRYLLQHKNFSLVPLREELSFCEAYRYLLEKRIGAGLTITLDIPSNYHHLLLPPTSLQLLLENAVKHNSTLRSQPLHIVISLQDAAFGVFVQVRNPIRPRKQPFESTGIGLRNLHEQYRLLGQPVLPNWGAQGEYFQVCLPLIDRSTQLSSDFHAASDANPSTSSLHVQAHN